jgi:cytosine/adenosine deaminase-related metal-dependent hydrolase
LRLLPSILNHDGQTRLIGNRPAGMAVSSWRPLPMSSASSTQSRILITGARVYNRSGDVHRPPVRDVIVDGNLIESITTPEELRSEKADIVEAAAKGQPGSCVIEGVGKLLIPGLVNAHYHSYDVLSKGRFEDMPFDVWALHSQPAYWGKRSREELRARTLLGAMECLRHGITTIQDMNSLVPQDEETLDVILAAYDEVGIRVVFSIAVRDLPSLDIEPFLPADMPPEIAAIVGGKPGDARADLDFIAAQIKRLSRLSPRLHWALSPSGPQRCSQTLLQGIAELSERHGLPVFTHVYETRAQLAKARTSYTKHGGSYIRYMAEIGLLTERTTLAHGVYLMADEIEQLARAGASVVHNPLSNLKLKNGVAPLLEFKRSGVNLALGCDNCSCSDCQNLFQAMKMFSLLSSGMDADPTGVLACHAVDAATIGGARAVGLSGQVGDIRTGMKADLVLIDLSDMAYLPFNSAARQLVYSETGRGVHTVVVDGRIVLVDGRLTTVDEESFRQELAGVMEIVDRDYDALVVRQKPAIPFLLDANTTLKKTNLGLDRGIGQTAV